MIALASSSVIAAAPELVPQSKQSAAPIDASVLILHAWARRTFGKEIAAKERKLPGLKRLREVHADIAQSSAAINLFRHVRSGVRNVGFVMSEVCPINTQH